MIKEKLNIFFALVAVAIIILATFAVVTQYQVSSLTASAKRKESLPLLVTISVDETSGILPFEVGFTPIISNAVGGIKYHWDFGDKTTSDEINPTYTYNEEGIFVCNLTIKDDSGKESTDTVEISAKINKPPVVTLSINQNTIEREYKWLSAANKIPGLNIFLAWAGAQQKIINSIEQKNGANAWGEGRIIVTAQVGDAEDDEIVSYEWVEHTAESTVTKSGEVVHPKHYFESTNGSIRIPELYTWMEGRHIVTLTVKDSAGNTANASIDFQVEKSIKKVNREAKFKTMKDLTNFWLLSLNPIVGAGISAALLAVWKYNNFTGVKLITLSILKLLFQIDIGDDTVTDQAKAFLDEHPRINENLKGILEKTQDKIEVKNPDSPIIETIQKLLEDLGMTNCRPILSDPKPENNHDNIDVDLQEVSITSIDPEGDPFNISIHGDYINDISLTNQYNGTFSTTAINPLPYDTEIYWHANISYGQGRWVNDTYMFKTRWS